MATIHIYKGVNVCQTFPLPPPQVKVSIAVVHIKYAEQADVLLQLEEETVDLIVRTRSL